MRIEEIDMDLIVPNRDQPRSSFEEKKLAELKDSIIRNGIIQPIVLVQSGKTYRIVAGERRWRAAMGLKMKKIPAVIRDVNLEQELEIAIVENIQRENLNPIEEAISFRRYLDKTGKTQEELSEVLSKSRSYISNTMRLLKLPEDIVALISSGEISSGHGRALLGTEDAELQRALCKKVIQEKWSVRELEKIISSQKSVGGKKSRQDKDIYTEEMARKLSEKLGTKVSIKNGNKKGKLEIEYYGDSELETIVDILSRQIDTV